MITIEYERSRRRRRITQVSKDIPEEIRFEILARLPVKSLLRLRCVCKSWNSLISSPRFMNAHLVKGARDYLLMKTTKKKSLSLICAETFAKCLELEFPRQEDGSYLSVYGSCNGLLCVSGRTNGAPSPVYLWNPSIRKCKRLPESLIFGRRHSCGTRMKISFSAVGFGFDCRGNDYKVVRIMGDTSIFIVEVYSLNLDSWRRMSAVSPISRDGTTFVQVECECLNGVVYWIINDFNARCNFILSFDMDSEIFQKVMLPNVLQLHHIPDLDIRMRVLEKSLSLLHLRKDDKHYCDLWVLEMDTWKMIRTILLPASAGTVRPLGFSTNRGVYIATESRKLEPHNLVLHPHKPHRNLFLYDPKSQQVKNIQIKMYPNGYIYGYRESLVLLN